MRHARQRDLIPSVLAMHPLMRTGRWRKAVLGAFGDSEDLREICTAMRLEPDAYIADHESRTLLFVEVEVFSVMSAHKLKGYAKFRDDIAGEDIDFQVFAVNRRGESTRVNLDPHYWLMVADIPEQPASEARRRVSSLLKDALANSPPVTNAHCAQR